ncbi:MAG: SRPBCC domain-containing protein [Rhizobacter sp.]
MAYTTPDDIRQWNTASDDWHTTKSTVDLRVGGAIHIAHGGQRRQLRL